MGGFDFFDLNVEVSIALEAFWPLLRDVEGALEGHADAAEHAFIEELADKRHAVGDAARRVELRQGMFGIRGPVAARLADFDKFYSVQIFAFFTLAPTTPR